jgi:hypothetical protein
VITIRAASGEKMLDALHEANAYPVIGRQSKRNKHVSRS